MKAVAAVVYGVSIVLLVATVVLRSELMLNILATWLGAGGLGFSLLNYRARARVRDAGKMLATLRAAGATGDFARHERELTARQDDGIVLGLVTAALGSLVGSVGQAIFLAVAAGG